MESRRAPAGAVLGICLLLSLLGHVLLIVALHVQGVHVPVPVPALQVWLARDPLRVVVRSGAKGVVSVAPVRTRAMPVRRTRVVAAARRRLASAPIAMRAFDLGKGEAYAALDEVVRSGREEAARAREGTLSAPSAPPKTSRLQQSLQANRPPDCQSAYAGMGLLAIAPLLRDTLGDKGCRW